MPSASDRPAATAGASDSLRDRLRHETGPAHARTDAAFAALDLEKPGDLARFLTAHRIAFAAIASTGTARDADAARMADLVARIDADLGKPPASDLPPPGAPHPDAISYILLGSRLGTAMLKRAWSAGADPAARAMHRYFDAPGAGPEWRAFCETAGARPATGPGAERVVADALRLFGTFADALALQPNTDALRA